MVPAAAAIAARETTERSKAPKRNRFKFQNPVTGEVEVGETEGAVTPDVVARFMKAAGEAAGNRPARPADLNLTPDGRGPAVEGALVGNLAGGKVGTSPGAKQPPGGRQPYQKTFSADQERRFREVESGKVPIQQNPPVEQEGQVSSWVLGALNRVAESVGRPVLDFLTPGTPFIPKLRTEGQTAEQYIQQERERTRPDALAVMGSGLARMPIDIVAEIGVLTHPQSTPAMRGGSALNLLGYAVGPQEALAILKGGKGLTSRAYAALVEKYGAKEANAVNRALKEARAQFADVEPAATFRQKPVATAKGGQVVEPAAPKTEPPPVANPKKGKEPRVLAHRTSERAARAIEQDGFNLKRFGQTSKSQGLNYKQDPRGVSFIATDRPIPAGKGDAILYADDPLQKPLVIDAWDADGKNWRQALHERYGTNGDGALLTKRIRADGYDGIITKDAGDTAEIIVFDPTTIKPTSTFRSKSVPKEVLADHPDLAKKYGKGESVADVAPVAEPPATPPEPSSVDVGPPPKTPPGSQKPGESTALALEESKRRGFPREKSPDVQTDEDLAQIARERNYGTQEGAANLLETSKTRELDAAENVGIGARLASILEEKTAARGTPKYEQLVAEETALRSIPATETARALRARGIMMASDYSPEGMIRAVEQMRGGKPMGDKEAGKWHADPQVKEMADLKKRIADLEAENARMAQDVKPKPRAKKSELDKLRAKRERLKEEFLRAIQPGELSANPVPVKALSAVGRIVRSYIDEGGMTLKDAIEATRKDLRAVAGEDFEPKDIELAFSGYGREPKAASTPERAAARERVTEAKGMARAHVQERILESGGELPRRSPRQVSEELLLARRKVRDLRYALDRKAKEAAAPGTTKFGKMLTRLSTEIKLWNPVARLVDVGSNLQETALTGVTSPIDKAVANVAMKAAGEKGALGFLNPTERGLLISRYKSEMAAAWEASKTGSTGKFIGRGPATRLAGELDSPFRAWYFLSHAADRAKAIAKQRGLDFENVLDQIRDPEMAGPLKAVEADKLFREADAYAADMVLVNPNWAKIAHEQVGIGIERLTSKVKGKTEPMGKAGQIAETGINTVSAGLHAINDLAFQFAPVLVNVADKSAQYAFAEYGAARALTHLGIAMRNPAERALRAKLFAQVVRRSGIGAGLSYLGYEAYKAGYRMPEVFGIPTGPQIVQTRSKEGERTSGVFQDDGIASQMGGALAAFLIGFRRAQIDEIPTRERGETKPGALTEAQKNALLRDLESAPIRDNPFVGNAERLFRIMDPNNERSAQGLIGWVTGLWMPGILSQTARFEDIRDGVYTRRAEGWVQELQKRIPFIEKLPPKGVAIEQPSQFLSVTIPEQAKGLKIELTLPKRVEDKTKLYADRTDKDYQERVAYTAKLVQQQLDRAVKHPAYLRLTTDAERQKFLQDVIHEAKTYASREFNDRRAGERSRKGVE